jgi:hypothetical protein
MKNQTIPSEQAPTNISKSKDEGDPILEYSIK